MPRQGKLTPLSSWQYSFMSEHLQNILNTYTGEFDDKALEQRYQQSVQAQTKQQLRISLSVVAGLFFVFGIIDYYMLGLSTNFYLLMAMRATVAVACLLLIITLNYRSELVKNKIPLNIVSFLLVTSLILIPGLRPETINSQLTSVVVASFALYLFIPNRVQWIVLLNAYLLLGFLAALYLGELLPPGMIMLVAMVLILPNMIGLITALRFNYLQRMQFASLMSERDANKKLQSEIYERQRLEDELRHLAQTDELTRLNNRRWFLELAEQELRRARRRKSSLALCMIDLDHFKIFNDRKGHAAGDRVLALVADLFREVVREADIIGRFGGEEFVIALPDASKEDAFEIAERLRSSIENHKLPEEFDGLNLSVTIGIAIVNLTEESLEQALLRADEALYMGKKEGRNIVMVKEH